MATNGVEYEVPKDCIFDVLRAASGGSGPSQSAENLISVNSKAAIFKKRNFYKKLSLGLTLTLIVLIIAFIIILCFYVHTWLMLKTKNNVCTSKECIRTASSFKLSMDFSVNPCEDFYQYCCKHWSEEHPNHGWYPKFSNFELIEERVDIAARNFLRQNNSDNDPLPVKQTRLFYQSCMNIKQINKLGITVMYDYLKQANLPLVPRFFLEEDEVMFDWKTADINLKKLFDMDLFVGFTVDADVFNKTNNVIYMGAPSAGSPLPSLFKKKRISKQMYRTLKSAEENQNSTKSALKEKSYKNIVKFVIKTILVNVSSNPIEEDLITKAADLLYNMTYHLEELSNTNETEEEDIIKVKLKDIQVATENELKKENLDVKDIWGSYINSMFNEVPNVTLDLDGEDLIYTTQEDLQYLHNIAVVLSKTSNKSLELLAWWSAIQVMVGNTGYEISNFIYKEMLSSGSLNLNNEESAVARLRSLDCAELVIKFMGIAVSYGIAEETFLNETKPRVELMLKNIKEAFVKRVKDIKWMDEDTKRVTLQKKDEMLSFIGFPDWLLKKEDLETYYKNIVIKNDTYLDNMMSFVKLFFPYRLKSLREENERGWIVDPTTVNAFNYFSENSIYVPMAILTFPMYNLGLEVLNYGSIGTILGHELTHGFDNSGRLYDQNGNYRQWWSNETIQTFVNKTECFVEQYDSYKLQGIDKNIQGKATLGENIADNGGLSHAFVAYKNYVKKNENSDSMIKKLPGFENFSDEQMFFIAFGSIWCEERNVALLKEQIVSDAHCPSPIRVLGTLQNSEDFSRVFNCPKGSRMNPDRQRCQLW